jgi:hypothetical protein
MMVKEIIIEQELKARQDQQVFKEFKVLQVLLEQQVLKALQELMEQQEQLVYKEYKDFRVYKVQQALQELQS